MRYLLDGSRLTPTKRHADGQARAKLGMPAALVPGFVAKANIRAWTPTRTCSGRTRASGIRTARSATDRPRCPALGFLHVAIDDARPQTAVVYVMLHGT